MKNASRMRDRVHKISAFSSSHPGPNLVCRDCFGRGRCKVLREEGAADQDLFKAGTNNKQQIFSSLLFHEKQQTNKQQTNKQTNNRQTNKQQTNNRQTTNLPKPPVS